MNQQNAINENPPVGFLSPALYAIGLGSNYTACFHDITTGNNVNGTSTNKFFAVPGYDLCTGWGTPNGSNLINVLAPYNPLRISPAAGLTSSGQIGGSFSAGNFLLANASASSINWSLCNTSIWFNVSLASGTVAPGTTASITMTPTYAAKFLPAGNYTAVLWLTNLNTGTVQIRPMNLAVQPFIQNGGFETGDLSSWTLSGGAGTTVANSNSFAQGVHSGAWGAKLSNVGLPMGYLSQTLPTVAGQRYLLSFWLNSSANPNSPHKTTPNEFLVAWNGTTLWDRANLPVAAWTNLQFTVTATSNSSELKFGFRDDPWALGLDDVAVQPVPSPGFATVAISNAVAKFTWNAMPGFSYQMQFKTNLNQSSWINLGGVISGTNLTITTADSVTGQQRFYRIVWN